jgi:hypothetical protein
VAGKRADIWIAARPGWNLEHDVDGFSGPAKAVFAMTASFNAGAMKSFSLNAAPSLTNFTTSVPGFKMTTLCAIATFGTVPRETSRMRSDSPGRARPRRRLVDARFGAASQISRVRSAPVLRSRRGVG